MARILRFKIFAIFLHFLHALLQVDINLNIGSDHVCYNSSIIVFSYIQKQEDYIFLLKESTIWSLHIATDSYIDRDSSRYFAIQEACLNGFSSLP